jgi:hypothetical protein
LAGFVACIRSPTQRSRPARQVRYRDRAALLAHDRHDHLAMTISRGAVRTSTGELNLPVSTIPEPSTWAPMLMGPPLIDFVARRRSTRRWSPPPATGRRPASARLVVSAPRDVAVTLRSAS